MSDIFDHECDAFDKAEAMDWCLDDDTPDWNHAQPRSSVRNNDKGRNNVELEGEGPCPKCGSQMRFIENAANGPFYGCRNYPKCHGTRQATAKERNVWEDNRAFWAKADAELAKKRTTTGVCIPHIPFKAMPDVKTDPSILCHPNIPKPLHGIAPRVIAGDAWWDAQRKKAYEEAYFRCQACGTPKANVLGKKKWLEAHETYEYDYKNGRLTFKKLVALCPYCHSFIHSGRLNMLYESGQLSVEDYAAILLHGNKVLKNAKLKNRHLARHDTPCWVRWKDWRMVFEGREYGPSTTCEDDWIDGLWKDWKPPRQNDLTRTTTKRGTQQ